MVLIECKAESDVVALNVQGKGADVRVTVQDDPHEARGLITAQLLPSQAIRLARALLAAAGVHGTREGHRQTFTFID